MIYKALYWFGIITGYPVQLLLFKRKTYYESDRKPDFKGGALIISNHFNTFDYIVNMFVVLPRMLSVVSSEMPFANWFLRWGMKTFGGIQANRKTNSMQFIDETANAINNGKLVQIFPEGHNTPDGRIHSFKPSYVMIAEKSNKKIIPIISDGNYGLFKRTHVIIGDPIFVDRLCASENPSREEINEINKIIHEKCLYLRKLLDEKKGTKK